MFQEELKTLRRLGLRYVRILPLLNAPILWGCSQIALQVLLQMLNFASVIASGLMIWKGLGLVCNTESPIVVVLRWAHFLCYFILNTLTFLHYSGSMEPAFYRGDLLFLTNPKDQRYGTGDITVYRIPGADIPIVHRVIETHDVVSKGSVS